MRRLAVTVLAVAVAAIAAAPAASAQPARLVVAAGHGSLAGGAVATVAAFDVGRVGGVLRVESAPGFLFVSRVTCVRVVDGRVLVGGVIVRSPTPATLGHTSLVAIEDGGPGGTDLLGLAFSNSGLDSCPVFDLPMHPVQSGNFVVVAHG